MEELKSTDYANRHYRSVYLYSEPDKDVGHSAVAVQVLLGTLLSAQAGKGETAKEIVKVLTGNPEVQEKDEEKALDSVVKKWVKISVAGVERHSVAEINKRSSRLGVDVFATSTDNINSAAWWLSRHVLNANWQTLPERLTWIQTISGGKLTQDFPAEDGLLVNLVANLQVKGKWETKLEKYGKSKDAFALTNDTSIDMVMLEVKTQVYHHKNAKKGYQMIAIPCQDSDLVVVFMLPLAKHKLSEVDYGLGEGITWKTFGSFKEKPKDMTIAIPMFESVTEVDLKKVFSLLGMSTCFGKKADFSGLSKTPGLHVGGCVDRCSFKVSSSGFKLCALASMTLTSNAEAYRKPSPPKPSKMDPPKASKEANADFIVNQPFRVFVYDKASANVLFALKVVKPTLLNKEAKQ